MDIAWTFHPGWARSRTLEVNCTTCNTQYGMRNPLQDESCFTYKETFRGVNRAARSDLVGHVVLSI